MISLRPYQRQCLDNLYDWFRRHPEGHPIVNACVGSGKSIMLAQLCHEAVTGFERRSRLLMIVPSKELCEQNLHKLSTLAKDLRIAVLSASLGRRDAIHHADVVIGTIGTLHKRGDRLGYFDLLMIDECHLVNRQESGMYRELVSALRQHNSHLRVVGWTGTPFRGNGVWLTEGDKALFTDIAAHVGMSDLLQQGYLSPLVSAKPDTQISADNLKTSNGDYVIADLAKLLDRDDLTDSIARQIVANGQSRAKWLVYCVTVEHAVHMAQALKKLGIACDVISATTPKIERERSIARFRTGQIRCICNVAVLTTGFDVPEVDLIALVRNTKSPVLYVQIAGRGMRTATGKTDCLWLDFTDTTARLGPVNQIHGRPEPKVKTRQAVPSVKTCGVCGAVADVGQSACATCGVAFPVAQPKLNDSVSDADVLLIGKRTLPVDDIFAHSYLSKKTGKSYLSVRFRSGLQTYSKNLMLGFDGYAGVKAMRELNSLVNTEQDSLPETAESVLRAINGGLIHFKPITEIEVDFDSPYKDITAFIQGERHADTSQ